MNKRRFRIAHGAFSLLSVLASQLVLGQGFSGANQVLVYGDGRILAVGPNHRPTQFQQFAVVRYLANGDLDPSFGHGGQLILDLTPGPDMAVAATFTSDERVVVLGSYQQPADEPVRPAVVRLTANGRVDETFGDGGLVLLDSAAWRQWLWPIAVTAAPDGQILVTARSDLFDNSQPTGAQVFALTLSGRPDLSFGVFGRIDWRVCFDPFTWCSLYVNSVALSPSGDQILVGGAANSAFFGLDVVGSGTHLTATALDRRGRTITAFGQGGNSSLRISDHGGSWYGQAIVAPSGAIFIAGDQQQPMTESHFVVAKMTAAGAPELTFGEQGIARVAVGPGSLILNHGLAIQVDGKIVVVGQVTQVAPSFVQMFGAARLNPDGSTDETFNGTGSLTLSFLDQSAAKTVAVTTDNKIVIGGAANSYSEPQGWRTVLVRLNSDGSRDPTFGADGVVMTHAGAL